jgi:hypothetical protein
MTQAATNTPFIEIVKSERDLKIDERKRILDAFKKVIASQAAQGGSACAFSLSECCGLIYGLNGDPSFGDLNRAVTYLAHDLLAEGFKISASFTYTLNLVVEW